MKASLDYFIDRQVANGEWTLPARFARERYRRALTYIARSYGRLAAICEEEYIFNWLAWDGDNVLASGAILDYGSIRQFAAKHDKYRYDDIDRFSTSLVEQKFWARENVKVFAQAMHFARTGRKLNLREFQGRSVPRAVRCVVRARTRMADAVAIWVSRPSRSKACAAAGGAKSAICGGR